MKVIAVLLWLLAGLVIGGTIIDYAEDGTGDFSVKEDIMGLTLLGLGPIHLGRYLWRRASR